MNEDILRQIIEQSDPENKIPRNIVDDIVYSLEGVKDSKKEFVEEVNKVVIEDINPDIDLDWRTRASIAAKRISDNL